MYLMELLFGLVLLEGSLPVSKLSPALHHLVHYASQVNFCLVFTNLVVTNLVFTNLVVTNLVVTNVNCVLQVLEMGILQWISMFSFERNNKRIKGLVRNSKNPISSLANNLEMGLAVSSDS